MFVFREGYALNKQNHHGIWKIGTSPGIPGLEWREFFVGIPTRGGGLNQNIGVFKPPKMDGENNGKPYEQMDDLGGGTPNSWETPM